MVFLLFVVVYQHASGTLRKNRRLGFAWKQHYLDERVCFEFGWTFESIPRTRVLSGVPNTEGDCHSVTEAGWFIDRYMAMNVMGDQITPCYLNVEYPDGTIRQGIGMIVDPQDRPSWLPGGHVVFAIVSEYDADQEKWPDAENPC